MERRGGFMPRSRSNGPEEAPGSRFVLRLYGWVTIVAGATITCESNRSVAAALGVSEETVKTHVASVLSKLQVENRAQAAVQALKRGLIDDVS